MITDEIDQEIRELQNQEVIEVNCGNYTIKRPLTYKEAKKIVLDRRNKGTLKAYFKGV